jgi:hypothetical protein
MPKRTTFLGWVLENHDGLADRYARARETGWHAMAEETLEIADDGANDWMARNKPGDGGYDHNGEHSQRSRLRVDTRKWLLSKVLPKVYGDKLDLNHSGSIAKDLNDDDLNARIAALLQELRVVGASGGEEDPSAA